MPSPPSDRLIKSVAPIPHLPLAESELFPARNGLPDWSRMRDHFIVEGKLEKRHVLKIIADASTLLKAEPNLLKLSEPITVVGDIHGQFYDLLKAFEVAGPPSETQYLFLGDYVDRGAYSVEVLLTLFAMKITYPTTIWLLRGNHECRQMTGYFNFKEECEYKYDLGVYEAFLSSFDAMPLAAVINGKFFACHGGIGPGLKTLSDINAIDRFHEPPKQGLMCDLLWADPEDEETLIKTDGKPGRPSTPPASTKPPVSPRSCSPRSSDRFSANSVRGCSVKFGYTASMEFLEANKLLAVVRGHEAQPEGYRMHRANPKNGFPTVITVFSAPNYCDVYNSKFYVN